MPKPKKVTTGQVKGKGQECVELTDGTKYFQPDIDLKEALYTAYAEKLTTGETSRNSWLSHLISENLNAIKKNIKSDPITALSASREVNKIVKDTQEFFDTKKEVNVDFSKYLLREILFKWQREVYDSNSKKKTMLCGRRSGKSFTVVELALKHCLEYPKSINGVRKEKEALIMGLTVEKTAALYWDNIKTAIERAHINTRKIDNGSYTVTFSNGNTLALSGNNSKAEREKLRGKDLSFVAIDECQSQQGLYYLINDIINPMLKGTDGELVLLGTAPLYAGTPWEMSLSDPSFEHFHATMEDNPSIPDFEHALQTVLEENHWTPDNITFRREYLGEIAYDTNRLIYGERHYYDNIPETERFRACYIGVDFGWSDYSSFMPIIINDKGVGYLVEEYKEHKIPSSKLVEHMKVLTEKIHKEYNIPVENIYIVADSSHQQVSQDFYNVGVLNLKNAYKLEQNAQIARVAEALATKDLLIKKDGPFDLECNQFVWQWNEEKGCVIYKIDDNAFHGDAVDAVQYAWNNYIVESHLS